MQTFTVEEAARRWLSAPKLDPETERAAAEATIAFLTDCLLYTSDAADE